MSLQAEGENPLWQFSLSIYGQFEIESHCLSLQDGQGDDVNCLLLCCWCGLEGIDLSRGLLVDLLALPAWQGWCDGCIRPLRSVRRDLKEHPFSAASTLRKQVQALELAAEKAAQDFLLEAVIRRAQPGLGAGPALLVANLQAYRAAAGQAHFLPDEMLPFLRATFASLPERELKAAVRVPQQG